MSQSFVKQPTQEPLASHADREAEAQAALQGQKDLVARIQASQRAALHSPMGLRNLFPTNRMSVKVGKKKLAAKHP